MDSPEYITEILKERAYDDFKFEANQENRILPAQTVVCDNNPHYGIRIKFYSKEKFNFVYDDFVTYIILFGDINYDNGRGYILTYWKWYCNRQNTIVTQYPTKKEINKSMNGFYYETTKHLPDEQAYNMVTFGDGNLRFMFLEYTNIYVLIIGDGS